MPVTGESLSFLFSVGDVLFSNGVKDITTNKLG